MTTPRALLVGDIIDEIVEYVAVNGTRRESKQLLARLARVSSIFRDPCFRRLWADMNFLDPLFKLLTNCEAVQGSAAFVDDDGQSTEEAIDLRGTFQVQVAAANRFRLTLRGDTSSEELVYLKARARLIRVLRLSREGVSSLELPCWHTLTQQVGHPLLPCLRVLTLPVTPPYPSEARLIVASSIRELSIVFPAWHVVDLDKGITDFFNDIFARAPHLTHLKLKSEPLYCQEPIAHGNEPVDLFYRAFCSALSAVRRCQNLELFDTMSMEVPITDVTLLGVLSTLPCLRHASIRMWIPYQLPSSLPPGFRSLSSLVVSGITRGHELYIFDCPHLCSLSITQYTYPESPWCLQTLEIVARRFSHIRHLSWMACNEGWGVVNSESDKEVLSSLFRPLHSLTTLETLVMDVGPIMQESDMEVLVTGLPQLVHLRLTHCKSRYYYDSPGKAALSARALVTIAQACPALLSLHLPRIYVPEASFPEVEAYSIIAHGLRSLYIAELECKHQNVCAMIIDMTFPWLNVVECRRQEREMRPKPHYTPTEWPDVLTRLEAFHRGRDE
ncbi:hypothetical protein C8Q76DRAFT_697900 [Earliella scabrosa]|nr:hypothetical protein C8Q76DRAFT_697900 [Earliella scabrosa]